MFLLNDANFLQQIHNLQESLFVYRRVKLSSFCMKELHDIALNTDPSKGLAAVLDCEQETGRQRGEKHLFFFMGLAVWLKYRAVSAASKH